jgi:hypothetical protein
MTTRSEQNHYVSGSSRQNRNAAISARAYQIRELIEEQRLLKDQLADFWEPRSMEERSMERRSMEERSMNKILMKHTTRAQTAKPSHGL